MSRINRNCRHCGEGFSVPRSEASKGDGYGRYCSRGCKYAARRTRQGFEYCGMWFAVNGNGYYENTNTGTKLHRFVYEQFHGPIPPGFQVHHKDDNKVNNDPENLEAMSASAHTILHNSTGVTVGEFVCLGCRATVVRKASDIKKGESRYCTRSCAMLHRPRDASGRVLAGRVDA